ncbi:MAG: hypothetical protein ACOCZX_02640 [Candidatus Bipolaricaulota bacterium]
MKWGGNSEEAANKLTEALGNVIGTKGLYILITLAAFALLTGAPIKWRF